jgi:hypothetical protein
MNTKLSKILFFVLFLLIFNNTYSQDFTKKSIKIGSGVGFVTENTFTGCGIAGSIGYQYEIWKDRLRLNPNFRYGYYISKKLVLDVGDQKFNSYSLELNLYFDVAKTKSFSFIAGIGGFINNMSGKRTPGYSEETHFESHTYTYYRHYHFGGSLGFFGFRINPPTKRIAVNILPLNIQFSSNGIFAFHSIFELDIKL